MADAETSLGALIHQVELAVPTAEPVERLIEAQRRALTLHDVGEQLVGHFVYSAKNAGVSWASIGGALGVSKQAVHSHGRQVFAGYTRLARQAVVQAQDAAREHRHGYVGTEHLLLGLLGVPDGLAAQILARHAGGLERARTVTLTHVHDPEPAPVTGNIPFTPRAKKALDEAAEASTGLSNTYIGTEHLLLGLLATEGGQAAIALHEVGLSAEVAKDDIRAVLDER